MKRINLLKIFTFAMLAMVAGFTGCNTEDVDFKTADLSVSPLYLEFDADGTPIDGNLLSIASNRDWKVTFEDENVDWIRLSTTKGSGNSEIPVVVLSNEDDARSTRLVINTSTKYEYVTVSQRSGSLYSQLYYETFNGITTSSESRPTFSTATGYDMGSPIVYSGTGDIRSTNALGVHAWFAAAGGSLKIENINTADYTDLQLSYDITANIYNSTDVQNVNAVKVYCDGTEITVPSFELNRTGDVDYFSSYYTVTLTGLPDGFTSIEFVAGATMGMRIDNIKITGITGGTSSPRVTTADASNVAANSATLGGSYSIPTGTSQPSTVGVEYWKDSAPASKSDLQASSVVNPFTVNATGLDAVPYSFRAYAIVDGSAVYGATKQFTPGGSSGGNEIFSETFGAGVDQSPWPKIADYTAYDNQGTLTFSDTYGTADIRKTATTTLHAWFKANGNSSLKIGNIPAAGKTNMVLKFDLAANLYDASAEINQNVVKVSFNGVNYPLESKVLSNSNGDNNKFYTITINLTGAGTANSELLFETDATNNMGFRIDNIILTGDNGGTPPTLAFQQATFSGSLTEGTAASATELVIPYTNATGSESYSGVSVNVGGAGAGDLAATVTNPVTLTAGSNSLRLAVTGTPTAAGQVTFTINGITELVSPLNTVNVNVASSGSATPTPISTVMGAFSNGATVASGTLIKGLVVSDRSQENLHPSVIVINDGTNAGDGVTIKLPDANVADNTYGIGDEITIDLTDGVYTDYNGLEQIVFASLPTITVNSTGNAVNPVTINATDLNNYMSMYVAIDNVQVKTTGGKLNAQHTFTDGTNEFNVYNRSANKFGTTDVPAGKGTIKGIVSIYNSFQLVPRNMSDYSGLTGNRDGSIVYGNAAFSATTINATEAIVDGKITVPYNNSPSVGTVSVSMSTSTSIGIDPITNQQFNVVLGSGQLEIPVTGTPTTAGPVTFNITIDANNLTATGTVNQAGGPPPGGSADFGTLGNANSSYATRTTTAGWEAVNAAIYQGGSTDNAPTFSWIGPDNTTKAICLNGKTTTVGVLTSPEINTGIGTLSFKYGHGYSESNGVSLKIEVIHGGTLVKTENLTAPASEVVQHTAYQANIDLDVTGSFTLKITNNSPSNSTSNKDRIAIWDVEWTGAQ